MIGNHRNSWVLGSVDPTGGTAALVEISRAFSALKIIMDGYLLFF